MGNSVLLFTFIAILSLTTCSGPSWAYVPPSHFVANKLTQKKGSWNKVLMKLSLLRTKKGKKLKHELLWSSSIVYHNEGQKKEEEEKQKQKQKEHWPLLAMFLEKDPTKLIESWKEFQLDVSQEEELTLFKKEELKILGEIPNPFYKMEENTSYRRLQNQVALSYESKDKSRALLVEKDSFLPLMLFAPCPKGASNIQSSFNEDDSQCFVKFSYDSRWRKFYIPTKSTLNINGRDTLILRIDSLIYNPKKELLEQALQQQKKDAPHSSSDAVEFFRKYFLSI